MDGKSHLSDCPICGHKASPLFSVPCDYRKPLNSKRYDINWCKACNYGYVWERPSKAEIPGFYQIDNYYTHNDSGIKESQSKETFLDRLRLHLSWRLDKGEELTPRDAMDFLNGAGFTMCEIGCGNGGNLLKFLDEGFAVLGVEPDPNARSAAEKNAVSVFNGTAEELPEVVSEHKYDVVLMSHVLEHCLDINTAVLNVKSILKKDGVFIVETPNCSAYGFKDYQGEWPWSDIPRHLNFFTPPSLSLILAKHGFNVAATKYYGFCRQFTNSWLKDEAEIWQSFVAHTPKQLPPNFKLRAWKLLLKSMFSPKASKYDSVRLIAVNS